MWRYRDGWLILAAATAAVGIWTAMTAWGLLALGLTFGCVAVMSGCMAAALTSPANPWRTDRSYRIAAVSAASTVAAGGIGELMGATVAIALLLAAAVTCPSVLGWIHERLPGWTGRREKGPGRAPDSEGPTPEQDGATQTTVGGPLTRPLNDPELCWAWRHSYVTLQRADSVPAVMQLAARRQYYLDEFERRNPSGFAAWLASGARAAGDPSRYMQRPGPNPPS